eukprot:5922824-Prymnesium_polylepis.1
MGEVLSRVCGEPWRRCHNERTTVPARDKGHGQRPVCVKYSAAAGLAPPALCFVGRCRPQCGWGARLNPFFADFNVEGHVPAVACVLVPSVSSPCVLSPDPVTTPGCP